MTEVLEGRRVRQDQRRATNSMKGHPGDPVHLLTPTSLEELEENMHRGGKSQMLVEKLKGLKEGPPIGKVVNLERSSSLVEGR